MGEAPSKGIFFEKCLVKYCNFVVNLDRSLCHISDGRIYVNLRVFFPKKKTSIIYEGIVLWFCIYSERGDYERVKRKLQRMCCRFYPFIFLDKRKGLEIYPWIYTKLGEPCIFVSLFYCILMCFISTFILLLCDDVF